MKKALLIFATGLVILLNPCAAQETFPAGFTIRHAVFFKGAGGPKIPASWRLVSVTNDRGNPDAYNLWFQDKDGAVYQIKGYDNVDSDFTIGSQITELDSTNCPTAARPGK